MSHHFESRELVSNISDILGDPFAGIATAECIQHATQHSKGGFSSSRAILGSDISHIAHQHKGVGDQLFAHISESCHSFYSKPCFFYIQHRCVVIAAILDEFGAETSVLQRFACEVKPFGYDAFADVGFVHQFQHGVSVRLFFLGSKHDTTAVCLTVQSVAFVFGNAGDFGVVQHAQVNIVHIVFVLGRKVFENLIDIVAKLILRVINHHRGKCVAVILADGFLLRLLSL